MLPAGAPAATLAVFPVKPCYRSGEDLQVGGTGFTPFGQVRLTRDAVPIGTLTADGNGAFAGKLTVAQPRGVRTKRFTATDLADPSVSAFVPLQVSALSLDVGPAAARAGRPLRVRARGFTTGRTLYAHVVKGRYRRNVRVGRLRGPCGTLSVRRRIFPGNLGSGRYTVQYDTRRTYSRRTAVKQVERYRIVLVPRRR